MLNNLPTDNLYKFCALSGLGLIIFNSYYNFEMLSKSGQDMILFNGELKKHQYELILQEAKAKELYKELKQTIKFREAYIKKQKSLVSAYKKNILSKSEIQDLNISIEKDENVWVENGKFIDSLQKKFNSEQESLKLKTIDIDTKSKQIDYENNKNNYYTIFLFLGSIIGVYLTKYGFINWIKIQKILDENLKKMNNT